ncbi:MAG: tetratricopeptide repeat protein [Halanaerobiales bacterium]
MKEEKYLQMLDEENENKYEEALDLLAKRDLDQSEKLLLEIRDHYPDFVPLYNKLGIINIHRKEYEEARQVLSQAIEKDNEYVPAITNLGSLMREMDNRERARELYKKAIEIDPEYGLAHNNLGVIYREEGNYVKSVKSLKKARKYGGYHVDMSSDKPFYKEPGCLFIISILFVVIFVLYILLT